MVRHAVESPSVVVVAVVYWLAVAVAAVVGSVVGSVGMEPCLVCSAVVVVVVVVAPAVVIAAAVGRS